MSVDTGLLNVPKRVGGLLGSVGRGASRLNQRMRDIIYPADSNDPQQLAAQRGAQVAFGVGLLSGQRPIDALQSSQGSYAHQLDLQAQTQDRAMMLQDEEHKRAVMQIMGAVGKPPENPAELPGYLQHGFALAVSTGDANAIRAWQGFADLMMSPKPPTPHNIDPNSPEGIEARLKFERERYRPPHQTKTKFEEMYPALADIHKLDSRIIRLQDRIAGLSPDDDKYDDLSDLLARMEAVRNALELDLPPEMQAQRQRARVTMKRHAPIIAPLSMPPVTVMATPPVSRAKPTAAERYARLKAAGGRADEIVRIMRREGYNVQ